MTTSLGSPRFLVATGCLAEQPLERLSGRRPATLGSSEAAGFFFFLDTGGDFYFHGAAKTGGPWPKRPTFLKAIPAAGGAHHGAFSPDERYAFVQNSLIQLPGMSDGSITVIDLREGKVVRSIDTFKNAGLNPNMIVLLPQR